MDGRPWRGLPRVALLAAPTPFERAERFSKAVGAEVWLKRDDHGAVGLAGNKVRKLEFVLARAIADGADAVVILGAQQSNAARATAACAARLGLACHLVLGGDGAGEPEGNVLLDRLFGATVHPAGTADWEALDRRAAALEDELRTVGRRPLRLPAGASSPLGTLGFARAWEELADQAAEAGVGPEAVYHASSSGGTHAGLLLGRALAGATGPRVQGVEVAAMGADMGGLVAWLAREAAALVGAVADVEPALDLGHIGPGYAQTTPASLEAIALLARTEGIVADPVYSGKALAALVADARRGRIGGPVVFWHTGGVPAAFARPYAGALAAAATA